MDDPRNQAAPADAPAPAGAEGPAPGDLPAPVPGAGETDLGDAAAPPATTAEGDDAVQEPASGDAPVGETPAPAEDPVSVLQRERDDYLALAQRTQADFENFRRRMSRENAAALDKGVARLAKELLGALDHLELALRAAEAEGGALYDGVRIVQQELLGALGRVGIQAYDPKGTAFDPNEHEAMVQQPAEGAESGTVLETYQQGYRINGTVLRPARVVVAA